MHFVASVLTLSRRYYPLFVREIYSLQSVMNSTNHQVAARVLSLVEKVLVTEYFDSNGGIDKVRVTKNTRIRGSKNVGLSYSEDVPEFQNILEVEKQMISSVRRLHSETLELLRNRKRDDESMLEYEIMGQEGTKCRM